MVGVAMLLDAMAFVLRKLRANGAIARLCNASGWEMFSSLQMFLDGAVRQGWNLPRRAPWGANPRRLYPPPRIVARDCYTNARNADLRRPILHGSHRSGLV